LGSLPTVLAILAMPPSWADMHDGYVARAPLFADDSLLEVRIEAPITTLMDVRPDVAYLDGSFTYAEPDGSTRKLSLKLRTRGNYRRDPSHCSFAPIRLNFVKSELKGTLFEGQDKLKLVTHCRTIEGITFEQVVAREYFAYRLLHEITSISYAVRMFDITYVDTESGKETHRLGFVIEDDKAVAKRNGLRVVKLERVAPEDLDPRRQNLVHLFSYLIANTEYSFVNPEPGKECCHNIDVLSATGGPPYLPLPFDFDFAGIVNAPYAQPNPRYPIRIVRTRFYKGVCSNNALLPESIELLLAREDAIRQLIEETGFLSPKSQRSIENMVDKFYAIIADPGAIAEYLTGKCNEAEDVYEETSDP
jgi:hypothetical protein